MHPTFKHLEDRIRLGGLALGQWAQLLICGVAAYLLSTLLPLPGSWSVSVAVTVCGLPAARAIAFMSADFNMLGWVRAAATWHGTRARYVGTVADDSGTRFGTTSVAMRAFDAEALWD